MILSFLDTLKLTSADLMLSLDVGSLFMYVTLTDAIELLKCYLLLKWFICLTLPSLLHNFYILADSVSNLMGWK